MFVRSCQEFVLVKLSHGDSFKLLLSNSNMRPTTQKSSHLTPTMVLVSATEREPSAISQSLQATRQDIKKRRTVANTRMEQQRGKTKRIRPYLVSFDTYKRSQFCTRWTKDGAQGCRAMYVPGKSVLYYAEIPCEKFPISI